MAIKPIEILIKARDQASGIFGSIGAKLTAVGVAIATYFGINAFVGAVKGAADLEAKLSEVKAVSGATAAEMVLLRQAAEDAGATPGFNATGAADALANLTRAGLTARDAIATLPPVMALAKAAKIGLADAAEYVTKTVMGMGLAISDTGRVVDVLVKGADSSNTSVTGLAQAMSYAAPVANSLGLSLEFTVAMIGKMADGGIDASRAGTALNAMMSQFADPASKFRTELAATGITTGNFEQALRELAAAGPAGEKAILAVGTEAGPALRSVLNQGIGALDDLKGKLDDAAGSAAATAAVMEDNLQGSFKGLSSVWDTVKNALATPVLPVLKDAVTQLVGALRAAVSDGTIVKFGEAITTAFQSGLKWAREFLGTVDFAALAARMQAFAASTQATFTKIGEYATNAGNIVKFAYGVMSAGANAVMTVVYGLGVAFAGVAAGVQNGLALLMEGMAKITFGGISAKYKQMAADIRQSADATTAASRAMADKTIQSFTDMGDSAQLARDGFTGLASSSTAAASQASASTPALKGVAGALTDIGSAATDAATKVQSSADKQQAATEALKQKAKADAKAIADAFSRMGIKTRAELAAVADVAKQDFERIKASGLATTDGMATAFKAYAEAAISANGGVASSGLQSEAAMRGLEVATDRSGKSIVRAMGESKKSTDGLTTSIDAATSAAERQTVALEKQNQARERAIASKEKENQLTERANALERERLSIDKEGFSTDKDGKRINAGGDLTTLTGITAFLKSAGVADEAKARAIAREFADGQGNITYMNNPGQRKYGGDTISMALLKAAETYTFGTGNTGTGQQPSTIPTPAKTYTVNINLGGTTTAINTSSDADAQALISLLQRAKLSA